MSASSGLSRQFLYHFSPRVNQTSIQQNGLLPGRDGHVYVTANPKHYAGFAPPPGGEWEEQPALDMYRVNVKGLSLQPDPNTGDREQGALRYGGAISANRVRHMGDAFEWGAAHGAFDDLG